METSDQFKWSIIACSNHKNEYLHINALEKSNPDAQIIRMDFTNQHKNPGLECDAVIREWFRSDLSVFDKIQYNNIAFVEYDVLITTSLPNINLENELVGPAILNRKKHPEWFNWKFLPNMLEFQHSAVIGLATFSVYFMSKNCLDIWLDEKYDPLYEQSVCCELRFPTILYNNGVSIKTHESLKNVIYLPSPKSIEFDSSIEGIYHPVKYSTDT